MKIENNPINPLSTNKTDGSASVKGSQHANENAPVANAKDKAELSERARLLGKARTALDTTSDVDQSKVESLQNQIKSGDYKIPLDNLAQKLLTRLGLKSRD
jgi:flagellar biosynthesis anti-sigma factor FlgM